MPKTVHYLCMHCINLSWELHHYRIIARAHLERINLRLLCKAGGWEEAILPQNDQWRMEKMYQLLASIAKGYTFTPCLLTESGGLRHLLSFKKEFCWELVPVCWMVHFDWSLHYYTKLCQDWMYVFLMELLRAVNPVFPCSSTCAKKASSQLTPV